MPVQMRRRYCWLLVGMALGCGAFVQSSVAQGPKRIYDNRLTPIPDARPLLADHPEFVHPVEEVMRYEAPMLIDEDGADLSVRSWRFSYNARGIIEMPNRLRSERTAVIMVHPWGIDDGQGWKTPEPAVAADFCTPTKNHLAGRHTREVIDPFLRRMRKDVALTLFSIIGEVDPLRKRMYRTFDANPSHEERMQARKEIKEKLNEFRYEAQPIPATLTLSKETPVIDYFQQFPGLDAGPRYNPAGFWSLPVPISSDVTVAHDDVLIFDVEGYDPLKTFLKKNGIRHVLLTGYATDMCFCKTTAGYENLSKDFNVFLVGDATLATFPANSSPRYATNAHISFASLNHMITQVSWIQKLESTR